jgi:sec-independent protein translocase protein TatB
MFDIGWSELLLIGVVALVVIGPKDLPKAIYAAGKWVRKARMAAREFQVHIDDMMREAELDDLRQQALKARDMNLARAKENSIDPAGEIKAALAMPPPSAVVTDALPTAVVVPSPATAVAVPSPAAEPPAAAPLLVDPPVVVAPPTPDETADSLAAANQQPPSQAVAQPVAQPVAVAPVVDDQRA